MELTITKNELNNVLSFVQNVVQKKTTMPILANVLLSTEGEQLTVAATDLEITAIAKATAKIDKAGRTTLNAKVFYDVIRELPDDDISLSLTDGERVEIKCGKSVTRIIGVSADEYPGLPGQSIEVNGQISCAQLSEMVSKTLYAVSQDETRFNLNGVSFEIVELDDDKMLRMVATDGHRLAMITRPAGELSFKGNVLVPRKGLLEVKKLVDEADADEMVGVGVEEGFFVIETKSAKVSMRLIDGEFPDYRQVMPKQKGKLATMNSQELAMALRRVALMVTDKAKGVRLDFTNQNLQISSSSPELGDAKEELDLKYDGEPLSVGFNARYIIDITSSLEEGRNLSIELNGELGAGKFYAEGDDSYVAIVMPMRLN